MKRQSLIGTCLLLGLSVSTCEVGERVIAGEPLPDVSMLAYWAGFGGGGGGGRGAGGESGGGNRQRPNQNPQMQQQPKISEVTLTGIVNDVQSSGLTINATCTSATSKSKEQKIWLVTGKPGADFTIRGTATLSYLRKGQTIEFKGQIISEESVADAKGGKKKAAKVEKIADAVDQLTIVSRMGGASLLKKDGTKANAADAGGGGRIEAPKEDTDSTTTLSVPDDEPKADTAKAKPAAGAAKPKMVSTGRR